jgi:hypothetical protein
MPTHMLTGPEQHVPPAPAAPIEDDPRRAMALRRLERIRHLKIAVAAWGLGTIALTAAWVAHEWQANGAFQRFGHEGNPGDWNPTLLALAVLTGTLVVGVMALRTHLDPEHRLRLHVSAWLLGMIIATPLNMLIEWQDNGGFQRFSRDSRPGSWDPWILIVGGIWALVIAVFVALPVYLERRRTEAQADDEPRRFGPDG